MNEKELKNEIMRLLENNKNESEKLSARYHDLLLFNHLDKPELEEDEQAYYEGRQSMLEDIMDILDIEYKNIKEDIKEEIN